MFGITSMRRITVLALPVLVAASLGAGRGLPLVEAIRAGDEMAARALIATGQAKVAEPDGTTPLHHAAHQNNIVLVAPPGPSGENRRFDTPNIIYRPEEPDPNNRFRMITWVDLWLTSENAPRGIHLYRSADGLSWELLKTNAIANAYECNSFFWDQRQGKYIGIVRQIINYNLPRPRRYVCYTESHDFLNWTDAKLVTAPEDMNSPNNLPGDEPYLQASFPYESHYLGFLWTYHVNPRPPSTLSPGAMEVQLRSSLDARHWAFVGEGEYILPNDPPGAIVPLCTITAPAIVPLPASVPAFTVVLPV